MQHPYTASYSILYKSYITSHIKHYPIAFGLPATVPWIVRPVINKPANLLGHFCLQVGGYVGHVGSSWPQAELMLGHFGVNLGHFGLQVGGYAGHFGSSWGVWRLLGPRWPPQANKTQKGRFLEIKVTPLGGHVGTKNRRFV